MLVWMDLEMTGLEPNRHVIVEIATIITDDLLEIVAEGPDLVIHAAETELAEMDDFVRDMHVRSGLLEQIRTSSITTDEAMSQTLNFIKQHIKSEKSVPLCGNSIGTDRRFLDAHMPEIEILCTTGQLMFQPSKSCRVGGIRKFSKAGQKKKPPIEHSTTSARASLS